MSVLSGKIYWEFLVELPQTASLVRLIKAGAHVQVIMTPASKDFVTPPTLSTLSKILFTLVLTR
jgi:phosphopantothenoylcysteine decarboxylase/phosphopantothenate--cysteine ligase